MPGRRAVTELAASELRIASFTVIGTLQLFSEPVVLRNVSSAISSGFTPNMLALAAIGDNDDRGAAISLSLAVITFLLSLAMPTLIAQHKGRGEHSQLFADQLFDSGSTAGLFAADGDREGRMRGGGEGPSTRTGSSSSLRRMARSSRRSSHLSDLSA